jgi:hypothetical protein
LEDHFFLRDHVLNGKAVLPAAITMEWLAHAALHENPGLRFAGFDNFRVTKGIVLEADPVVLHFYTGKMTPVDGCFRVPVAVRSGGAAAINARADILLTDAPLSAPTQILPRPTGAYPREDEIYDLLFHGEYFHAIQAVSACDNGGIVARVSTAKPPRDWMKSPLRGSWLGDPLAMDAAFQAAILWCLEHRDAPSLPTYAASFRCYKRFPADGLEVVLRVYQVVGASVIADVDFVAADGQLIARMEGYECIVDAALATAFQHNRLPERAAR